LLVVKPIQILEYTHSTCVLVFLFTQQFFKFLDLCVSNMNSIAKVLTSFSVEILTKLLFVFVFVCVFFFYML